MKQMWLPVFELPDTALTIEPAQTAAAEEAVASGVAVLPGQIALFGEAVQVLGDLLLAIESGDFRRASDLRRSLVELEGESRDAMALAFVDELARERFWRREPAEVLADWRRVDQQLPSQSPLREWVQAAVVRRLIGSLGAAGLVQHVPSALPLVANCMLADAGAQEADTRSMEARELVRDALAAGRSLGPQHFEDPEVCELLAEDMEPQWLACLGFLRRIWPCPPPDDADVEVVRAGLGADTSSTTGAAIAASAAGAGRFWSCLKVVAHVRDEEPLRLEARRQMKRLHAGLHAICMRQPSLAR